MQRNLALHRRRPRDDRSRMNRQYSKFLIPVSRDVYDETEHKQSNQKLDEEEASWIAWLLETGLPDVPQPAFYGY